VNVDGYPAVKRDDICEAAASASKPADDGVVRALEDADDSPLEAARRVAFDTTSTRSPCIASDRFAAAM
jgi:hypothetical protein